MSGSRHNCCTNQLRVKQFCAIVPTPEIWAKLWHERSRIVDAQNRITHQTIARLRLHTYVCVMELSDDLKSRIGARNLMVFDGVCVLCNTWLRIALRFDRNQQLTFVTAQSDLGTEIYKDLDLLSDDYESFIVYHQGRIYTKLDGAFALFRIFGGLWHIPALGRFTPKFLKNTAYDLVAKNRYKLFGRTDQCMIPTPDIKARSLDSA